MAKTIGEFQSLIRSVDDNGLQYCIPLLRVLDGSVTEAPLTELKLFELRMRRAAAKDGKANLVAADHLMK